MIKLILFLFLVGYAFSEEATIDLNFVVPTVCFEQDGEIICNDGVIKQKDNNITVRGN